MANPIHTLNLVRRLRPPAPDPSHRCPVCGHTVTADTGFRMRGGWFVHRACATYRVRREFTGS